jgi:hypothetical protein
VTTTGRRIAAPAVAVLAGVLAFAAVGCSAAPTAPPQIPPTSNAAAHQDSRITLPVTVGVAFHHPALDDRTEYGVLFTVQQAMRSMVQAEYSANGQDGELSQYWSGSGMTAVDSQIRQWISKRQQPVGMIVLDDTQYTAADGGRPATVSFCADWSHVVRGESRTHVVGAAVQAKGTGPTFERLGVARSADKRWRVVSLSLTPNAHECR